MLRTAGRLLAVTAATISAAAALQGTALAGPGETFGLTWGTVGACYERSVEVSVSSPDPNEYIQFQLSVTVGTTTKRGAITTVPPQNGGPVLPQTVSVKDCSLGADGQTAVYDVWVNGYKNALAAPDYVFDQAHGYSVCDSPAAAGCTNTDIAAPVITRTPVA
jgi:hypothetical protein